MDNVAKIQQSAVSSQQSAVSSQQSAVSSQQSAAIIVHHKRKRILYVPGGGFWGGASLAAAELIIDLKKRYDIDPVVLVSDNTSLQQLCAENGVEFIHSVKHWPQTHRGLWIKGIVKRFFNAAYNHRKVLHDLKGQHFDLVHSNSSFTHTGDIIAKHFNIPHVWHIRESLIDHSGSLYSFSGKYVRSRYDASAANITISRAVYENIVNVYKYCSPRNTRMIYDGMSPTPPYEKIYSQDGRVNFVMSGWINAPKNQLMAVKALQILKTHTDKFTLHILGHVHPKFEKYAQDLKALIHSSGLDDHVKFWGWRDDLREILKAMDVGLMLSKFEGFGRVTIEYMFNYMPVLGVDTGATPELVSDGETGYICSFNDHETLAALMLKLIENPSLLPDLGHNGRERAITHFPLEKHTDEVYRLYQEIL